MSATPQDELEQILQGIRNVLIDDPSDMSTDDMYDALLAYTHREQVRYHLEEIDKLIDQSVRVQLLDTKDVTFTHAVPLGDIEDRRRAIEAEQKKLKEQNNGA